jgi:succinoglycan biosynthesis protein ExoA
VSALSSERRVSAATSLPMVTIAMPCLDEERFIETCVRSVLEQDYPRDRIEVLVADGGSTDRTREILARLASEDERIFVIDNPDRIQAAGLNAILRASRGDVIVRMDVHCEYASDYVRRCIDILERTGADNVGGAQRARAKTRFQRALCAALRSPLGVGGAKYRSAENEGFVDTVFLGAFRRGVFDQVGMYDPSAVTNEDAELNHRIVEAGLRVYLSPEIVVHYHPRESFRALARQYFRYGTGRARTLMKHRKLPALRSALPFLAVTGATTLLATAHLHPLTPVAFGGYALATAVEAVRVGRSAGLSSIPLVWAIFPVLHASHGIGFAAGLVQYGLVNRGWSAAAERLETSPAVGPV